MSKEIMSLNQGTADEDYTTPFHKRPDRMPTKRIVYCTSYACNRPEVLTELQKKHGFKNDRYRVIRFPPKNGWCQFCGSALLYTRAIVK